MDRTNPQEPPRTPTAPVGNVARFATNPWTPPSSDHQHQNSRQHPMPSLMHSLIPGPGAPYRQGRGPMFLGQHVSLPPLEFRMSPFYSQHESSTGLAHGRSGSASRIPDTPPVLPQPNFGPSMLSPGQGPASDGDNDGASGTGSVQHNGGGGAAGHGLGFQPQPVLGTAPPGATLETHSPLTPAFSSTEAQPSTFMDAPGSQPSAISQQPHGAGFTPTTNPRHSSSNTVQIIPPDLATFVSPFPPFPLRPLTPPNEGQPRRHYYHRSRNRRNMASSGQNQDDRPATVADAGVGHAAFMHEVAQDIMHNRAGVRRPGPIDDDELQRELQVYRGSVSTKMVASRAALQSLQSVNVSDLPEGERTCVICYNEYGIESPEGINEAPLRLPKCQHVFGDHCIKKWFEDSDNCPYCRDKLPGEARHHLGTIRDIMHLARSRGLVASDDPQDFLRILMSSVSTPSASRNSTRRSPPADGAENQRRTRQRLNHRSSYEVSMAGPTPGARPIPISRESARHHNPPPPPQPVSRNISPWIPEVPIENGSESWQGLPFGFEQIEPVHPLASSTSARPIGQPHRSGANTLSNEETFNNPLRNLPRNQGNVLPNPIFPGGQSMYGQPINSSYLFGGGPQNVGHGVGGAAGSNSLSRGRGPEGSPPGDRMRPW
jgi:hypothetical protein